jgi:hypothetical protein
VTASRRRPGFATAAVGFVLAVAMLPTMLYGLFREVR